MFPNIDVYVDAISKLAISRISEEGTTVAHSIQLQPWCFVGSKVFQALSESMTPAQLQFDLRTVAEVCLKFMALAFYWFPSYCLSVSWKHWLSALRSTAMPTWSAAYRLKHSSSRIRICKLSSSQAYSRSLVIDFVPIDFLFYFCELFRSCIIWWHP